MTLSNSTLRPKPSIFDSFVAENVTKEELWQVVKDHDLFEAQGEIGDCLMRELADRLHDKYPSCNLGCVFLMDKIYVACLRRLAFVGKGDVPNDFL